jgi:hypothetical protein
MAAEKSTATTAFDSEQSGAASSSALLLDTSTAHGLIN